MPTDTAHRIARNLAALRQRIDTLATAAGRDPHSIQLVAMSKLQPWPLVAAAIQAGQLRFGENTVQEALDKITHIADPRVEWHFTGHLQSNKAKQVAGHFAWLHSLDSQALAARLDRLRPAGLPPLQVLIEVNVTGEAAKHGVAPNALFPLLEQLTAAPLSHVRLRGLMTMAAFGSGEDQAASTFARLRELRDAAAREFKLPDFTELSMGMSGDYPAAIREGATFLRIGTAIFGEREYD